jgi:hypothetical protein
MWASATLAAMVASRWHNPWWPAAVAMLAGDTGFPRMCACAGSTQSDALNQKVAAPPRKGRRSDSGEL